MANIETLLADTHYFVDQGSDPSSPSAGNKVVYVKSGGLYLKNSSGTVTGPVLDETAHDALDHTGLTGVGGSGTSLLGVTRYQPGTDTTIRTFTTSDALVDGTNLTVTFTAPASGNVIVRFTGVPNTSATAGTEEYWTLWEGGALIGTHRRKVAGPNLFNSVMASYYVTGISAGSHTYQWAGYKASANAALLSGGPTYGAALMEVWSA